jgi:hypothetical protein
LFVVEEDLLPCSEDEFLSAVDARQHSIDEFHKTGFPETGVRLPNSASIFGGELPFPVPCLH